MLWIIYFVGSRLVFLFIIVRIIYAIIEDELYMEEDHIV